jgi:gamma-glutamyl:cysteine ligase YbdK (ATP-grasp superfamily)
MGQEISSTRFKYFDFHRYDKLLKREMEVLRQWFRDGRFSTKRAIAGLELEAWLVDASGQPTPWNEQVIARAACPDVVPELSRFNIEFNVSPQPLAGNGLARMASELEATWRRCEAAASDLGTSVVAIGVLPTLTDAMLSLSNMSKVNRYQALNEQVLRLRQGRPIRLNVKGRESLVTEHRDVMLESATTSFQLHLQVPLAESVRSYNAAVIASAAMVGVSGNSPLLFGASLWDETRIPLFEQAVDVGGGAMSRVTFGSGYARESLLEVFAENQEKYPVLLPLMMEDVSERLAHIRLQNGTIWRWNRPLIGFDDDGTPHLRVEHRVMPAGPTLIDMSANMAFFYGLAESLRQESPPPESQLPFEAARDNFYRAARHGLDCDVQWLDGAKHPLRELILSELLPRAISGLQRLEADPDLTAPWLEVIEARVRSGQTGAEWQRRFMDRHGRDLAALTQAYRDQQRRGDPVHTWTLDRRGPTPTVSTPRSMLRIVHELPRGLLEAKSTELLNLLGQPTLIHLPGQRPDPLFVSILQHGNEDVGLRAIQAWFRQHGDRPLPRALSLFVANVEAAQVDVRHLPHQQDYNRVWPGSERDDSPEHAMMRHVVAEMRERHVFASIDFHNNTGWNPHYTCVCRLERSHLHLAALFSRNAVYFQRPRGVQTKAFSEFAPSVTCECGKVGDESGVQHATEFLDACLHLSEIPQSPLKDSDLHLFHSVATLNVPPRVNVRFGDLTNAEPITNSDFVLRSDLEQLNFQDLQAGTVIGRCNSASAMPLTVTEESGRIATDACLIMEEGQVNLRRGVIPAMLTCNEAVIRQDCLGYFMQRYSLPDNLT